MTKQQRDTIDQIARHNRFDLGGDVEEQRPLYAEMISAIPIPEDVHTEDSTLGDVPVVTITIDGVVPTGTILYFHGGGYAIGSAALSAGLASELARRSGARAVSVDYALAPEHPYPAAVHDAVAAYQALLDDGTPADGLRRRARDYAAGYDLADGLISPVFADLTGCPPLLIHVGGNEVLLDDATRLAARAAADGVPVTLEVTPDVPHVFVGFAGMLDEADEALTKAGQFIRANLARVPN